MIWQKVTKSLKGCIYPLAPKSLRNLPYVNNHECIWRFNCKNVYNSDKVNFFHFIIFYWGIIYLLWNAQISSVQFDQFEQIHVPSGYRMFYHPRTSLSAPSHSVPPPEQQLFWFLSLWFNFPYQRYYHDNIKCIIFWYLSSMNHDP